MERGPASNPRHAPRATRSVPGALRSASRVLRLVRAGGSISLRTAVVDAQHRARHGAPSRGAHERSPRRAGCRGVPEVQEHLCAPPPYHL
eukprot:scaffold49820_cov44-Phaeocystis_antarctica.AAC.2